MDNEKDLEKDSLLKKIRDVKKTNELFHSNENLDSNLLRPRKYNDEKNEENLILPKRMREESVVDNNIDLIKPRKKNHQSFDYENIDRGELEKTVSLVKHEFEDVYSLKQKATKKLSKEAHKIEKKIVHLDNKALKLKQKNNSDQELSLTIEIKDNYAAAMQQINMHIEKIKSDFDPDISLAERRKQIYENSKLAETERAQRLIFIRNLERSGKKLKKASSITYGSQSFYHKELKNKQDSSYINARNPYHKKMQEINDVGGVEFKEEPLTPDAVAEKWNNRKSSYDKNGRSTPKFVDFEDED